MSYIEKEKLIKADIASIENRVRHAFNQGYDLGFKDGKKRTKPQDQELCDDWYDVPSDEMTLKQARQAVKDLRKKLAEYLEQEPTTKNDLGVDCISRAEAIRVASGYCHPSNVAKELANLPSVTPQEPKWIPVSERLPEENKTVIASTIYGVYPETKYTKEYGWEWAYESGADYWRELANVKAWMPLPQAYREVEE